MGPMLITHWGLSGPVVLRLSAWAARDFFATDYHGIKRISLKLAKIVLNTTCQYLIRYVYYIYK